MSDFDIDQTIQSQYSSSPRIKYLIRAFHQAILPDADIKLFYDKIFNLETAEGIGLDIWGRIVGVERNMLTVANIGVKYFGLGNSRLQMKQIQGFDQAPFFNDDLSEKLTLSDEAYRFLIKAKALANISSGSLADLNRLVKTLLPHVSVKITRVEPMHLMMICVGKLSDFERNLLISGQFPPIPTGVKLDLDLQDSPYFGFNHVENTPFDQGAFYRGTKHDEQ